MVDGPRTSSPGTQPSCGHLLTSVKSAGTADQGHHVLRYIPVNWDVRISSPASREKCVPSE